MKKVLMISYAFPPDTGSGVIRIMKFAKYLPENGWMPVILSMKKKNNLKVDTTLLSELPQDLRVYRTPVFNPVELFLFFSKRKGNNGEKNNVKPQQERSSNKGFLAEIKKGVLGFFTTPDKHIGWLIPAALKGFFLIKLEKIDMIYSTSPDASSHLIGLVLKTLTRKPWVVDFRDPWFIQRTNITRFRKMIENYLQIIVLKMSDEIISNTKYIKKLYLEQYGRIVSGKINVITNGYDPEDFNDLSIKSSIQEGAFTISHLGEFYDVRLPDKFLISVSDLIKQKKIKAGEIYINLIGDNEYVYSPEFESLRNSLNLTDVVRIIRRVPHRQCLQLMIDSDVLLLLQPSRVLTNQIPAKAFEYARSGNFILTLAPENSATADIVREAGNGSVIDPEDSVAIGEEIYRLFISFKKRELTTKKINLEIKKFSRRSLTKDLADIFDRHSNSKVNKGNK